MEKVLFNDGWSFALKNIGEKPHESDFAPVDIPHDWLIHDTRNLYGDGDGFYKKKFFLSDVEDSVYIVRFDGVYMDSEIFLNGEKIFEWKYGYTSFDVSLDKAVEGENELVVAVHHKSPNTRWYSGAGIFRNVYITKSGKSRILPDGVYFSCAKEDDGWRANIDAEAVGEGEAKIVHTFIDAEGDVCVSCGTDCVLSRETAVSHAELLIEDPHLWDVSDPYLYTLKTELISGGESVYEVSQSVGFKTAEFTCDRGFFLNGRPLKIHGACMHHDMGALGSAVNKNAIRRQLEKMKEMGINSVRTSHNPPAPELMDLADEMGLLVDSEIFDMWELKKTEYDYARFFPQWHERDVRSWIRRDRNHVSIIMWSIGNEIYDTHASSRGEEIIEELKRCVRIDDYRSAHPITLASNYMQWQGAQNCAEHVDVVGYNYAERLYDTHHASHPEWIIYGSETGSTVQSRGIYHFPASKMTSTHDDHQCSSLMNCATGWGSPSVEYNIIQDRIRDFCLGQYIWTAWDYIGEPTPYWTKNSYFGHIDTAGFPKDSFYAYKAEWAGQDAKPFVHLFPYWDFNEGQLIDIFIYSNCAKTELIVNGKSLGCFEHDHFGDGKLSGRWQAEYHKGYIQAVGYDENGNELCRQTRRSFGDAARICLTPDKHELKADGEDLIFVEVSMLDRDGNPVENDRSRVNISVDGAGRLIGLDNGDSTDYGQYKQTQRKLFGGKLIAVIAAKEYAGKITVRASSAGLCDSELELEAVPAEKRRGVCCSFENTPSAPCLEVPARKIELSVPQRNLTPESGECVIGAKILPLGSTYTAGDVGFKVITEAGVETNIARVETVPDKTVLIPVADGSYRLRAYCKNGTEYEEVISELEMSNSGFGQASFDPYGKMVYASLYTRASHPLQNVFEGGVITPADGDSVVEFDNVDFGGAGSDEIRVGLYLNSSESIPFDITDDCGNLIGSFVFDLPPWWNHYQYQSYKLSKKLRGTKNLRFIFHMRVSFQGFQFIRSTRVNELIPATENSRIYGDSFTVFEDGGCIKRIGNNVTVEFNGFDFGEEGVCEVEIRGMSRNKNDTLHLRFVTPDGQDNQIVEFEGTDAPVTRRFKLSRICGKADVRLVFLPGCDFDLYSIKFIG